MFAHECNTKEGREGENERTSELQVRRIKTRGKPLGRIDHDVK